jgi:hypothetical protein
MRQCQEKIHFRFISIKGVIMVIQKSDDEITFDIKPNQLERVVSLKNNNVSSVSSKDTKKIYNELRRNIGCVLKISLKDNKQKIAKLDKVKIITKCHSDWLRLTASSDDFSNTGSFAKTILDLDENLKTSASEVTLDFISAQQDDVNNACQLDRIALNAILDDSTASDAQKVVALTNFAITYFNLSCNPPFERN